MPFRYHLITLIAFYFNGVTNKCQLTVHTPRELPSSPIPLVPVYICNIARPMASSIGDHRAFGSDFDIVACIMPAESFRSLIPLPPAWILG